MKTYLINLLLMKQRKGSIEVSLNLRKVVFCCCINILKRNNRIYRVTMNEYELTFPQKDDASITILITAGVKFNQ